MDDDIEALRAQFLNKEFDEIKFVIDGSKFAAYAKACGETNPKFTDPAHPGFQAPPTFVSTLVGGRHLPGDFPRPKGTGMDAGKSVQWMAPIRSGVTLTGRSHLHDIYSKTGRSGRMIFLVRRTELFDENNVHVANADARSVIREKPSE